IDEAERIDPVGQNELLKTLEEPPPGTTLILVTSREDRLLTTVKSRCLRVLFAPLPRAEVEQRYRGADVKWTEQEWRWMVDFAGGSLGRAQTALDYDLVTWARQVLPGMDAAARGGQRPDLGPVMAELIDAYAEEYVKRHAAENPSKEQAKQTGAELMWALLTQHARRQLREAAVRCPVGDEPEAEGILAPALALIDAVQDAERLVNQHVHPTLAAAQLVSRAARAGSPSPPTAASPRP
ncbi:MAG: hypothetical protein IT564_12355, partial [Rhodospirillales bacterium]|nr:hypothetical protein [Rhodospirillales bacterium]